MVDIFFAIADRKIAILNRKLEVKHSNFGVPHSKFKVEHRDIEVKEIIKYFRIVKLVFTKCRTAMLIGTK